MTGESESMRVETSAGSAYQVGLIVTGEKSTDKGSSVGGDHTDLFCLDAWVNICVYIYICKA